jgi:uncharacterized sulfatase
MWMRRRDVLAGLGAAALAAPSALAAKSPTARAPNIIIILADDLGFGDIGAFGARAIRTPHIDRLARQGAILTDYYAAANICTPSRAGLLTGRYPIRTGLGHQVIQPWDNYGLKPTEVTLAKALKAAGYTTGMVGKWHLGHVAPYWPPTNHGFDSFFGLPYSHDQRPLSLFAATEPGVEYVKDDMVDLAQLTRLFTDKSLAFIDAHRDRPFLLYVAHTAPHLPLVPHPDFKGKSAAHAYGDVVEELDAGVGRIMAALKRGGIDRDTIVIVTSDNGPWFEGSAGPLHDRKGGAGFDGGYRVPFVARYPRRIRPGTKSKAISMGIDIMPTLLAYAGAPMPNGVEIDGKDIRSVLEGSQTSPHQFLLLFDNENIAGIRTQQWKLVAKSYYRGLMLPMDEVNYTPLFDMIRDPGEQYSADQTHPDIVKELRGIIVAEQKRFDPFRTQPPPPPLPAAYRERAGNLTTDHAH